MFKTHFFPPSLPWSKKDDIISDKYLDSFYMTRAFPTRVQETLHLIWAGSAQDTYNIEVGGICRTRVSVHPGRDACLHMNDGSSHAVDVCFCCVASAKDNFRAHVNLRKTVKKKKNYSTGENNNQRWLNDILWSWKPPSEGMHPRVPASTIWEIRLFCSACEYGQRDSTWTNSYSRLALLRQATGQWP